MLRSEKCYHSTFTFTVHDDLLPMNNVSCYVKENAEVLKREDAHFKISVHSALISLKSESDSKKKKIARLRS